MQLKKSIANNSNILISFLSLFTSFSTLICCAFPALLVSLGMGATLIGLVSNYPSLIWVSEHKILIFAASFFMLSMSSILQYTQRNAPCPVDPKLAFACKQGKKWSKRITIFSIVVWVIGASFAFIPMLIRLN